MVRAVLSGPVEMLLFSSLLQAVRVQGEKVMVYKNDWTAAPLTFAGDSAGSFTV